MRQRSVEDRPVLLVVQVDRLVGGSSDGCESRLNRGNKRRDVPDFSVRVGEALLEPHFQIRLKPPIRTTEVVGHAAPCYGVSKGVGALIDVDLASGSKLRRIDDLPEFSEFQVAPSGWAIGVRGTGRIGEADTLQWFLSPDGTVARETAVPDESSEIASRSERW